MELEEFIKILREYRPELGVEEIEAITKPLASIWPTLPVKTIGSQHPLITSLFAIISQNLEFEFGEEGPPVFKRFNNEQFLKHPLFTSLAPYSRVTVPNDDDMTLKTIKDEAAGILLGIIKTFIPKITKDNIADKIATLTKELKSIKDSDSKVKASIQEQLTLLQDYNKIINLRRLEVDGRPYCTLTESVGGVTEKVCLKDYKGVIDTLTQIIKYKPSSLQQYTDKRDEEYALRTQAILKLPKGKILKEIVEVQREAIALNISRILKHNTTAATTVMYKGKPALFVPFSNIELLSNFARGIEYTALETRKKYQNHSTLLPIGEGLQSNQIIDDFGDFFAAFYLDMDPDGFGGYNQNKAVIGNKLYVFDQVVKPDDNFTLTSSLTLSSTRGLAGKTRHFEGRNKSLLEDSSFVNKFSSLFDLVEHASIILSMLDKLIHEHENQIKTSKGQAKTDAGELLRDAQISRAKIAIRINDIFKIFPILIPKQTITTQNIPLLKQGLLLEKMMQRPVLFTADGRPYRHPWVTQRNVKLTNIHILPEDKIGLNFQGDIPEDVLTILKSAGINFTRVDNVINIDKQDFLKLNESLLFPEYSTTVDPDPKVNYVDKDQLNYLKRNYKLSGPSAAQWDEIIEKIEAIRKNPENIQNIRDLLKVSEGSTHTENNGAFKHLQKKIQLFVLQTVLQLIGDKDINAHITKAFNAMIKLDAVKIFNQIIIEAYANQDHNSEKFMIYLNTCIAAAELTDKAQNMSTATSQSKSIIAKSGAVLRSYPTHELSQTSSYTSLLGKDEFKARSSVIDQKTRVSVSDQKSVKEEFKTKVPDPTPEPEKTSTEQQPSPDTQEGDKDNEPTSEIRSLK